MKKLFIAVAVVASLSGCYDEKNVVSIDGYWAGKQAELSSSQLDQIEKIFNQDTVKRVVKSPVNGIFEVHLAFGKIAYVSSDLEVVFSGEMTRHKDGVNLTSLSKRVIDAEKAVEVALSGNEAVDDPKSNNASNLTNTPAANTSVQSSSVATGMSVTGQSMDEFEKSIRARIAERKSKNNGEVEPSEAAATNAENHPVENKKENEFRTKNNMDVNLVHDNGSNIAYKGVKLAKIGFDKQGNAVSEDLAKEQMKKLMENIRSKGEQWSMVFPSTTTEKKGEIVVFTDPTCPHCRDFHQNMDKITGKGYDVRYLFFPRYLALGLDDDRAQTNLRIIKSIWCADNRIEETHKIYHTNNMTGFTCENKPDVDKTFPATEHYVLGLVAGLKSTPTIILPDGRKVEGLKEVLSSL